MVSEVHIPQKIHKSPNVLQAHIYVHVVEFVTTYTLESSILYTSWNELFSNCNGDAHLKDKIYDGSISCSTMK